MKIAVIAHGLRVAGGRSVAQNIIVSLARVASEHEYLLVLPKGVGYENIQHPTHSTVIYASPRGGFLGRALYDFFVLPRLIKQEAPDRLFCLGNFGIAGTAIKQAVLFHKAHFVYPEVPVATGLAGYIKNALIKWQIRRSLPATDLVFCQTQALRQRYSKVFQPKAVIEILPNIVSRRVLAGSDDSSALPQRLKDGSFKNKFRLFALTRYYSHKNLEVLVKLFAEFRDELEDVVCVLTVDENSEKAAKVLLERIDKLELQDRLINIGSVDQSMLPTLYTFSNALILPTLLESFSGTYIEAMHFKRPILTSDRDFARAVCGDVAEYFDPLDVYSIKDSLLKLKNNPVYVTELVARGERRLLEFPESWDAEVSSAMRKILAL